MRKPSVAVIVAVLSATAALVPAAAASAETALTPAPVASTPASPSRPLPEERLTVLPTIPKTTALWVNGTLRIVYSLPSGPFYNSGEYYVQVFVDGEPVTSGAEDGSRTDVDRIVAIPRAASAGPALIELRSFAQVERGYGYDTYPTTYFSTVAFQRIVKAKQGQVSAAALLDRLALKPEGKSGTFAPARFGSWTDANRDGQTTPTEVLRAESLTKARMTRHHAVRTGIWVSPFDGNRFTSEAELAVENLVPRREAWQSGAADWTAKKRQAYRNDLAFEPSLVAVSKRVVQARRDRDPSGYLPAVENYRCTYVRDWIAVKYRWGLSVDQAEKTALSTALAKYCVSPYVTKPDKPAAL